VRADNSTGQLGYPTPGPIGATLNSTPNMYFDVELEGSVPAVDVAAGSDHTCVRLADLKVGRRGVGGVALCGDCVLCVQLYCFGSNQLGALGYASNQVRT
jgi:hypothetical protein